MAVIAVHLRHLLRCERGATVLMVAILGTAVLGGALTAFDVARLRLTQTRLQNAVDAAALAATRDVRSATLETDVRQVFDANYVPGFLATTLDDFTITTLVANDATMSLRVEAAVVLDSVLAPLVGAVAPDTFTVRAAATTLRRTQGIELAMVLDNTGSMRSSGKIADLRSAAQLLTNVLYNGNETIPNLQVAVVPYTATVNIGQQHSDWLALGGGAASQAPSLVPQAFAADAPSVALVDYAPTSWKGCVLARGGGQDQTAATPAAAPFTPFWYPPSPAADCTPFPRSQGRLNCWPNASGAVDERNAAQNDGYGPNLGCGPPILPLTPSYTAVTATIAGMQPWHRGGTMANIGLVWGWRTLSPAWRGLWRYADGTPIDADRPYDYGHPSTAKVVVLMTDGNNEWYQDDFTAYQFRTDDVLGVGLSNGQARTRIDQRMTAACTALKAEGVVVYTVTLGSSPNAATRALYQGCASLPTQNPALPGQKYFHAPTGNDLREAFLGIAGQLSELRLLQ